MMTHSDDSSEAALAVALHNNPLPPASAAIDWIECDKEYQMTRKRQAEQIIAALLDAGYEILPLGEY